MKKKILLVDDSDAILKMLEFTLRLKGYIVSLAFDGVEALEIIEKNDFDIIVTDLNMPRMAGDELITVIRNCTKYKEIPIIVLTTESKDDICNQQLKDKIDYFLSKPFQPSQLIELVGKCLS